MREISRFLSITAEGFQQVSGRDTQQAVAGGARVGRVEIGIGRAHHDVGQLHAALLKVTGGGEEAGVGESGPRLPGFRHRGYRRAIEHRFLRVALGVVVEKIFLRHIPSGLQGHVDGFPRVLAIALTCQDLCGIEYLEQQELDVALIQ